MAAHTRPILPVVMGWGGELPGVVEIRSISDDPEYYAAPLDLFDKQVHGLPDSYGKKNKTTTISTYFTCNICECDMKSVVTLRSHCQGAQHIRKSLQKKMEWKRKERAKIKREKEDREL